MEVIGCGDTVPFGWTELVATIVGTILVPFILGDDTLAVDDGEGARLMVLDPSARTA